MPQQTVTLEQASERLGISHKVIRRLIESNRIPASQVVPWAPWEIPIEAIESVDIVQEVARAKRRPRNLLATNGPSMPMFAEIVKDLEVEVEE
jgi:hypothetical protein